MYNVSENYLEKINSVSREVYWYGTMTLTNGTEYNFDVTNLKQGQNNITRQLCSDRRIGIGGICSSELKLTFMLDYDATTNTYYFNNTVVDKYDFYDAEITLYFRLYLDDDRETFEDINLGTFVVSEPERSQTNLIITAYDYMQKFTKACVSEIQGTPYSVLRSACSICGVELGSTPQEIASLVNGRSTCATYDPKNQIQTWRDVIGFVASMVGANATIKSDNKLYIIPYNTASVRTISADDRVSLTLADYISNYNIVTSVNLRTNVEEKVKVSSDGLTYALGSNPLIQYVLGIDRENTLVNILYVLHSMDYTPFSGRFYADPSLELGDVITFTDNHAGTGTKSVITAITLNINSHMELSCEGDNPYRQKAEESVSPEYASETSGSVGDGVQFYDFTGSEDLTISNQETEVIVINYESNGSYRQEFESEIKLTVATSESSGTTYTENDCKVKATYYINGQELSYHPEYTYTDGVYLLHLFYVWTSNIRVDVSTFTVTLTATNGVLTVDENDYRGRIMQAGEAYVAPSNDIDYIDVDQRPDKDVYRLGQRLDYTGLVVCAYYEDGHKENITSQCTLTPSDGTIVADTNWIVVNVDYVKDEVPYFTSFDLEVKYLVAISVAKDPTKTEYYVGENIDLSGLKVEAEYSDDSKKNITSLCTYNPVDGTAITHDGTITVVASYTEDGIAKTCDIPLVAYAVVLEEIKITTLPSKLKYMAGDTLDYSGIVVTAYYTNGSTQIVTDRCTYVPANGSTASMDATMVTVSYREASVETSDTFDIEVVEFEGITVTTPPANTSYWLGDETDYSGIVVTGSYSDGTTEDVTASCTYYPDNGTPTVSLDQNEVIVSYVRPADGRTYTDTFSIEVKEPQPVLKYLEYTTNVYNRTIRVTGLNVSEIAEDNLRNLTIPQTYTDPESGMTFTLLLDGDYRN